MDLDDRVGGVVIAREQGGDLERLDALTQPLDRLAQFASDLLAFAREFKEGTGLFEQVLQPFRGLDVGGQAGAFSLEIPGAVGIAPDLGLGQLVLDPAERLLLRRDIKDTSGALRPCSPAR